jgi:gluconokinase
VLQATAEPGRLRFVYLRGDYETIRARMQRRSDHFMRPDMLSGQFAALEEPIDAITVDIRMAPDEIVQSIMAQL